ncbi:MAG: CoA-binding protein [Deltaproteobacteria bacterium]
MKDGNGHFLDGFLDPDSVAIVGASNNPATTNYYLVANLIKLGFPGKIYPVNPNEAQILGLRAYANVTDIDGPVDLAVIGVSHTRAPGILKECIQKGIKRVTIIAGGFSEAGEEGEKAQKEMQQLVKDHGIRAIGPNALSPINVPAHFCISFHPISAISEGGLSLIFQYGLYEPRFSWLLSDFNYHLNKLIDLGNKMDVNEVDALSYLVHDPRTRVIGLHLESIAGDGREFLRLLSEAKARQKPVVILKSGRTHAGARAAASHTGAMVRGSDRVFDSAIRQCGALRADTLEAFFNLTRALERFGPLNMQGNRIFLATFPGGEGVILTDLCEHEGLRLAGVDAPTKEKLHPVRPPWDIPANPWDLGLTVQFNPPDVVYRVIVEAMVNDPAVDALAIQLHPMAFLYPEKLLEVFGDGVTGRKPIVLWLAGMEPGRNALLQSLEEKRVVVFPSPEQAIHALSALHRFCQRA